MLQREMHGRVNVIRMDDGKVNAITTDLLKALNHELRRVEIESEGGVVITGNAKAFSAGLDLFRVVKENSDYIKDLLLILNETLIKLCTFPRPLVAAINGHAIAGGCVIAAACDYRLMAEGKGLMGAPELLVGVPFPTVALEILRFAIPAPHFQDLVLTGRNVSADVALAKGYIHEKLPASVLLTNACQRAEQMASIPPEVFRITKRQMVEPMLDKISRGEARNEQDVARVWLNSSTKSVIETYLRKTVGRKPEA